MLSRWLGAKTRKFSAITCVIIILLCSLFLYVKLKRENCGCQFWGCLYQNYEGDRSLNKLRRHISTVLLKAANDIKWGRKETAFTDLQMAAALLNHAQESNHFIILSNQKWPSQGNLRPKSYLVEDFWLNNISIGVQDAFNLSSLKSPTDETESLTEENLSDFVTIIFDECDARNQLYLEEKIQQLRQKWKDIYIVAGVPNNSILDIGSLSRILNLFVAKVTCDASHQVPLDIMLQYVKTPFVLVLRSIAAITSDLEIINLLQVALEVNDVGIVGVSERGTDGGWDYTCYQLFLENSRLTLTEGYEYSQGACVYCDVTSQSFLADTQILRAVLPDSSLPDSARQIDWAIRLRKASVLTLTCPGVMVHTTNNIMPRLDTELNKDMKCISHEGKIKSRDQYFTVKRIYRKLAQKWELTTINLHNKTSLEYSCLEIHFDCKANVRVRHFILPPCCLKLKHKMVKTLYEIARDTLVPCEMTSGTLLGAVKFKNSIPWDFDDDWQYPNNSVNIFKENKQRMRQMGLSSTFSELTSHSVPSVKHNYITMSGQGGFSFDLLGVDSLNNGASNAQLANVPDIISCLQYGHYPIHIGKYLHEADNITSQILTRREEVKKQPLIQYEILFGKKRILAHSTAVQFPPIPEKSCYLLSFVRIGTNWVVGPWNPALDAKKKYGDNLFKHRAHWRFERKNNSWPSCSYPGHPMCLDIHPLDGSIPFE